MISKQYRTDHQCLKLAFIEACIDTKGFYNNQDMVRVFGNHEKDAARIVARYRRDFNVDSLVKQSKTLVPSPTYRRKILKKGTNAWEYITMLQLLHGVKDD